MILRSGIVAAGMLCVAIPAQAAPFAGIYGDVRYIKEADDTVGIELRINPQWPPSIDFILCEGECAHQVQLPIQTRDGGFAFDYPETGADPDGRPAHHLLHFIVTYQGRNLMIRMDDGTPEKLQPLRKPVALR